MTEMEDLELARQCARDLVEHGIAVIRQGDDMHFLYDISGAYRALHDSGDDERVDRIGDMILADLEEVTITYQFKGDTVRDAELRRLQMARIRLQQQIHPLRTALSVLDRKIRDFDGE